MKTATKVLAFLVAIGAVYAAAFGVGRIAGPTAPPAAAAHEDEAGHGAEGDTHEADPAAAPASLPGLMVSEDGYELH